jgi:DNA replication protein DnaD
MKFRIEKLTYVTRAKEIQANTLEEALELAKSDNTSDWQYIDDYDEYEVIA